ncbi:MAG TPA: hypothetical protein VKR22_09465 [Acidimicrobiales bacterium]|nr:hypothetical protein [Acidimicrobiales bacterium]
MKKLYASLAVLAVTVGGAFGLIESVFAPTTAQAAGAKFWSVPGVINTGTMATVFSCTNGGSTPASVTVSIFNKDGTVGPTGTHTIAVRATLNFLTQSTAAITADIVVPAPLEASGSAQISAPAGVYCAAYITGAASDPPAVMVSLPVIAGIKQKGV